MTIEYGYLGAVDVGTGRVPNLQSNGEPIYTTSAENRWARELQSDDGAWRFLKGGSALGRGVGNVFDTTLADNFTVLCLCFNKKSAVTDAVSKGTWGSTKFFSMKFEAQRPMAYFRDGAITEKAVSSPAYCAGLNKWSWLAVTKNSNIGRICVNGGWGATNSSIPASIASTVNLSIGNVEYGIAATLIYNRVLTDTEVSNIMLGKQMPKEVSGLVGYYKFNESHGNASGQCTDYSGQGNHLTYSGAVWERFDPLDTSKTNLLSGQPYIARRSPTEPIPPRLDLNLISALDPRITFSRADATPCATYFGSDGLMKTAAANIPRFDYDPVTLTPKGLLIEESRANLLLYSNTSNTAPWTGTNTPVSSAVTAPDGSASAFKWTRTATSSQIWQQSYTKAASALPYVFSIYAKASVGNYIALRIQGTYPARADVVFDLSTGTKSTSETVNTFTAASAGISSVGNGWYRVWIGATSDTATSITSMFSFNSNNVVVDGTDSISTSSGYIFGAQLEAGSFPTSYIPTTTAAVTRAADSASMTGTNFSSWWNGSAGTFVVEGDQPSAPTSGAYAVFAANDGTANNYIGIRFDTSGVQISGTAVSSGVNQTTIYKNPISVGAVAKAAHTYEVGVGRAFSGNGASVMTQAGYTAMASSDRLSIGWQNGSSYLNGHISRIVYWPKRLPDTLLQQLTSGAIPENSTYYPTLNWWERVPPAIADPERMGCLHSIAAVSVSYNALMNITGDFSYGGWRKPFGKSGSYWCIFPSTYGTANGPIRIRFTGTQADVIIGNGVSGTVYVFPVTKPIPFHKWVHVYVTLSGTALCLYINGVLVGTQACSTAHGANASSWELVSNDVQDARSIRLFSRALSAAEVNELFLTDKIADRSNLVGEWLMNTPHSTTITDTSGNGLNTTTSNPLLLDSPYRVNRRKRFGKQLNTGTSGSATATGITSLYGATKATVVGWMKNKTRKTSGSFFGIQTSSGTHLLMITAVSQQRVVGYVRSKTADSATLINPGLVVDDYAPTLIALEYDYATQIAKFYKNGALVYSGTVVITGGSPSIADATCNIRVVDNSTWADDLRIYNRALTAQEHYNLYLDQAPRNGLVAEYKFDGDTTNCKDTSGNGFDATWSGITLANYVQEL